MRFGAFCSLGCRTVAGVLLMMQATESLQHLAPVAPISVETHGSVMPSEVRKVAAQSRFPAKLTSEGEQYDRLTGAALMGALRGKIFCPSPSCSGIDGSVERFADDGSYLVFGDRWDDEGRYSIVDDAVVVTFAGIVRAYAFYRSSSGNLRKAWQDNAGSIQSRKIFAKASGRASASDFDERAETPVLDRFR